MAPPNIVADLEKFKLAIKDDNAPPRACKIMLEEAVILIESLLLLKVHPSVNPQPRSVHENSAMTKILQEIESLKTTITQTQASSRTQGQFWANVANVASKPEVAGTLIRIQDEEEKKEIAKLSREEVVKKIGRAEVEQRNKGTKEQRNKGTKEQRNKGTKEQRNKGTKEQRNKGTKELMETQKDWTLKLAESAQVETPTYQVLVHDMPTTFEPENPDHLKKIQKANESYIMGLRLRRAAWLKKNKQPGKNAGSLIIWFDQAEHADKAISKEILWGYEIQSTEIFRSGFRSMQCFNCQAYGHIARYCTAKAKCEHCANGHNTKECPGKQETRFERFVVQERTQNDDWQIVGSRKRRAGTAGAQVVGADGEIIERRGPGRPKGSTKVTNTTSVAEEAKHNQFGDPTNPRNVPDCDTRQPNKSKRCTAVHHVTTKDTNKWTIIQYNVNKSKNKVQHYFLNSLDPSKHHVVAIQEPWCNPSENTTVKHPAYHLVFPNSRRSRTCIYVSKWLDTDKWKIEETPEQALGDITTISIVRVRIHNIYNPPPLCHSSQELKTLSWIPQILPQEGHHLLVGDFNLHHPRWGGQSVLSHHQVAENLMDITTGRNMELILPEGTITWQIRGSQSTIDLAFISNSLLETVMKCQPSEELESGSDHIPVIIELQIEPPREENDEPRPQWKKVDWDALNKRIAMKLVDFPSNETSLTTPESIDLRVTQITRVIHESVEELVPKANRSRFSKPYWTTECTQVVKMARRARRRWTKQGTDESWIAYCKATNKKKGQIKEDKQIGWRAIVSESTNDPQKIWKLAKWARKNPEERHRVPQIPDIRDANGKTHTLATDKATAIAAHFFPSPRPADTRDIDGYEYAREIEGIPENFLESEVEEALGRLAEGKAPGPDKIPGALLKHCRRSLKMELTRIFNACTHHGYLPRKFKESITVVIRKPQKPSYNVPKSYRPIALLNTMGKLLEKLIANQIAKAAEKYNFLPDEQMGARPGRSTITAVELLTEQIHSVWGEDKKRVASLLSLDISEAFDNVSHLRLIHTMRDKGIPLRITKFVESFLADRTTAIKLGNHMGKQISTNTGIPQGSPLSPILFLMFASTLLPLLRAPNSSSVGFVDDTNILTWAKTTEENCRTLERLHKVCEEWADKHGVRFAPEKYQLIHFSRTTKRHDLKASLHIQGHKTNPSASIRVLGVYLDPKLRWGAHIKKTQQKAEPQIQAITSLTHSTWGVTFSKARVLYSAIVRPSLTYGNQIWAQNDTKE
ncbi:hypothetical protein K3495_g12178 [Podosphaera aphanis]|nr:hypothetical protein K3495_g12178 [Podosphaera aphanis]